MKKVLILGVNGFIGHHLSKRILETTDWEVYGMDMQTERLGDLINLFLCVAKVDVESCCKLETDVKLFRANGTLREAKENRFVRRD